MRTQSDMKNSLSKFNSLALAMIFLGAFLVRIPFITQHPEGYHRHRQYHSYLIARSIYYDHFSIFPTPGWEKEVARAAAKAQRALEQPVLELITAAGYGLLRRECLWIPRLINSLLWIIAGVFIYHLLKRSRAHAGAWIALSFYLYFPFGVIASTSFQPDTQ